MTLISGGVAKRNTAVATTGETTLIDLDAVVQSGGTEAIRPASRIDIQAVAADLKVAYAAGEIAAGRYFTIPAGAIKTIDGPINIGRIFGQATGSTTDVEVVVFR